MGVEGLGGLGGRGGGSLKSQDAPYLYTGLYKAAAFFHSCLFPWQPQRPFRDESVGGGGGGGVGEGEEDGVVTLKSKPLGQFPERVCGGKAGVLQSRWGCGPSTPSHWCLKVCSSARGPITMSRRGEKSF